MLGKGEGHAHDVGLLEGVLAERGPADLAGYGDHRHGVHLGGCEAGDQVGGAGAAGRDTHADLAGRAGVAIGGVGGGLFVAGEDVL